MGRLLAEAERIYKLTPRAEREEAIEVWLRGLTPVEARQLEDELVTMWDLLGLLAGGPAMLPKHIEQSLLEILHRRET